MPVDITKGITEEQLTKLADDLGFSGETAEQVRVFL
jgi:hypothetical protein